MTSIATAEKADTKDGDLRLPSRKDVLDHIQKEAGVGDRTAVANLVDLLAKRIRKGDTHIVLTPRQTAGPMGRALELTVNEGLVVRGSAREALELFIGGRNQEVELMRGYWNEGSKTYALGVVVSERAT